MISTSVLVTTALALASILTASLVAKVCQAIEHIVFQYLLRKKRKKNDVEGRKNNEQFSNLGTALLAVVS